MEKCQGWTEKDRKKEREKMGKKLRQEQTDRQKEKKKWGKNADDITLLLAL